MDYKQNLNLSIWTHLVFGIVVLIASMLGDFIFEEFKLIKSERLKGVDRIVNAYEKYALMLDEEQYRFEEIEQKRYYLELFYFDSDSENKILQNEINKLVEINNLKKQVIKNAINSADIKIGDKLQGHLISRRSYVLILNSAKDSLRKNKNNRLYTLNESYIYEIDNMNKKLSDSRLPNSYIRDFAIQMALD